MRIDKLTCPHASYDSQMSIQCSKLGDYCAQQRWCAYKGWAVLTDRASECSARKDETHERKAKASKKRPR